MDGLLTDIQVRENSAIYIVVGFCPQRSNSLYSVDSKTWEGVVCVKHPFPQMEGS